MKKGFTLIELLAVIVVLAIIAVITIPTLTNVIEKSRINALKDSAYGIIEAGRLYIAQNELNQDILFTIENNNVTSEQTDKLLKYKGDIKNGIVVVSSSSKVAICIDNGKNYVVKLLDDTDVTTGIGTCEAYETENGKFTVNSPVAELKKEYERQLKEQKDEYENRINDLEDKIANSGAIYLGEFSSNTTIDVSDLGATSVDQFLIVCDKASSSFKSYYGQLMINNGAYGSYTPPTLELNNNILSVTVGTIGGGLSGQLGSSASMSSKVYYVGNIKTR